MPIRVTHGIDMERLGRLAFRAGRGQRRQEVADRDLAVRQQRQDRDKAFRQQRQLEAFTRDLTARIQQERDERLREFSVEDREDQQAHALAAMAQDAQDAQLKDQIDFQRKLDDDRVKWLQREAPKLNPQDRREVYAALSDISRIRNDQSLTPQQRATALEQRLTEAEERVRNAARPEDRWGPGKQDGDTWVDENTGATFTRTDGKVTKVESKPKEETVPPTYREFLRNDPKTVQNALTDARGVLEAQADAKSQADYDAAVKKTPKTAVKKPPRVVTDKEVMDLAEKNLREMYDRFYKPENPLSAGGTPVEDVAGQLAAAGEIEERQRQAAFVEPAGAPVAPPVAPPIAPAPAVVPPAPPTPPAEIQAPGRAYALNPSTGEWLYSDDGEQTWHRADGTMIGGPPTSEVAPAPAITQPAADVPAPPTVSATSPAISPPARRTTFRPRATPAEAPAARLTGKRDNVIALRPRSGRGNSPIVINADTGAIVRGATGLGSKKHPYIIGAKTADLVDPSELNKLADSDTVTVVRSDERVKGYASGTRYGPDGDVVVVVQVGGKWTPADQVRPTTFAR